MNDFETVRRFINEPYERTMPANRDSLAALDRIEAEVERLRGDRDNAVEAAKVWHREANRLRRIG